VLVRSLLVVMEDDVSVLAILSVMDLYTLLWVLAVHDTITIEVPHLGGIARVVGVHNQLGTKKFTVEHKVSYHGMNDPVGIKVPQLLLSPSWPGREGDHVGPCPVQTAVDLQALAIEVTDDTERSLHKSHCLDASGSN